jgi:N-ethylmaleimide reductase
VIEALPGHSMAAKAGQEPVGPALRKIFTGPFILNGGYTQETAEHALDNQEGDLVAFGVPYIANPDLVERYQQGAALNTPDPASFYGGDDHGYIDYPSLQEKNAEPELKQDIIQK